MSNTTEISAAQWLAVRERVVAKLGEASPRSEEGTRVRMAEELIEAGYIDVEFIASTIATEDAKREELRERIRAEEEKRAAKAEGQKS